jgi:hypothetical protein
VKGNVVRIRLHNNILNIVLVRRDDTPLKRALIQHRYSENHALTLLSEDVISSILYDEPVGGSDNAVIRFEKTKISTFLDFIGVERKPDRNYR